MQGRGVKGPACCHHPPAPLALSPHSHLCCCPLVHPIPLFIPSLLSSSLILVFWSSSLFVPSPPPHLVLITMWSSLLSSPHPCPCFIGVPIPIPVVAVLSLSWFSCHHCPLSSFSYPLVHHLAPVIHPVSRGLQQCGRCWVSF